MKKEKHGFGESLIVMKLSHLFSLQNLSTQTANMLCPAILKPEDLGYRSDAMSLEKAIEFQNKVGTSWTTVLGPKSLGQYTLHNQSSGYALARVDIFMRTASVDEIHADVTMFGEQVIGDEITEKNSPKESVAIVSAFGKDFFYTGPDRFQKILYTTRVGHGLLRPSKEDLTLIIKEIDELATEELRKQNSRLTLYTCGYYLISCVNGKMHFLSFKKLEEMDESTSLYAGHMEMSGKKLMFIPSDEKQHPLDFTEDLCLVN